jgi:hypothetical protein
MQLAKSTRPGQFFPLPRSRADLRGGIGAAAA